MDNWTHYWTAGQGNFVSSGMEDTGSYQSMVYLDNANKVVDTIVANWPKYKTTMPYDAQGNITAVSWQSLTQSSETSASMSELSSVTNSDELI
jgi:purine nucleoside permease